MSEFQDRLQAAVGEAYSIERELGGGGMSRVFVAEERALGRKVVIKVLPPEMGAGVNVERFRREIQLAAKLQHPHVVPLLAAGSHDDLLYYVMPYIEGESLRVKLAREGELPVTEAVRILREVVDALAYAHERGVVHRDIKPDNVLLSGKHALVTDFGVAKAVSEATGQASLTSLGVALGTPAYMAPEQAVADPHVDHRADIYAIGALAYEMLCGRPPFSGPTHQAVLAAHVTEAPEPVTKYRATVSPALLALVMRCLEKKAADRWQRAEEMLPHLEALLTPTGGITPTGAAPVISSGTAAAIRLAHPGRVAALFGAGSVALLGLIYSLVLLFGLPNWVFVGAVVLLVIGLPIMLLTGHHERRRALARTSGAVLAEPTSGAQRWFTWRRALVGGGAAFATLGMITVGYTAMRLLGIGPVGTLVASGVLEARDQLVVAEFENRTPDSTLGPTVTELFRVGLSQSRLIDVMAARRISEALTRMRRPTTTPVDVPLALEMAEREGSKAVVAGDIVALGRGYALSARLVSPTGQVLTAQQESARDADEIIAAVNRLSGKLRERIGESLRHIRSAPLDHVTTGSLQALRLYSQALRAENVGDEARATELLEEATRVDTGFAMAYRKLGTILGNNFEQRDRAVRALTKAYEHRDRLTDRERAYATGIYHTRVTGERDRAISAYLSLLDLYPSDGIALNNSGVLYSQLHDYARSLEFYQRALAADSAVALYYGNVVFSQAILRQFDQAAQTIARFAAKFPGNPRVHQMRALLAYHRGDYAEAEGHGRRLREAQPGNLQVRSETSQRLANLAALRGRLAEAHRHLQDALAATEQRGLVGDYPAIVLADALLDILLRDGGGGRRGTDGSQSGPGPPSRRAATAARSTLQLPRVHACGRRRHRGSARLAGSVRRLRAADGEP